MSWLSFRKKRYNVIEHYEHDDGEIVDAVVSTNVTLEHAEERVEELKELDKLFGVEWDYNYSIVPIGALHNE